MELTSLYLHVPFCRHRCAYCDFNTYAGINHIIPRYVDALCKEVKWVTQSISEKIPVHTIYFGGGTPSLLSLAEVGLILNTIHERFVLHPDVEITIEANPGTLSREYLQGIRGLGINRLSIGMQSAHPSELHLLERIHSFEDVINSIAWARVAGIDNISIDLIYGLPSQTLEDWRRSLDLAIGLHPEHFSLYALTLEEDVLMARWIQRGLVADQDVDLIADMYEMADSVLEMAGYESYEISNWAKCSDGGKEHSCRHNLQYWQGKPYLGLGAGSHGYVNHIRTVNVSRPRDYINTLWEEFKPGRFEFPFTPATIEHKNLNPGEEMGEYMMMGLRLTQEGVKEVDFTKRFDKSLENSFGQPINRLITLGLLEWNNQLNRGLRLTKRGRLLGNQVFCEFI